MKKYEGKVAIVTGAASGIGRALSEKLARQGANVTLTDVNSDLLREATASITASGGSAKSSVLDVSDRNAVEKLIKDTVSEHGRLDYLFNNAGIAVGGEGVVVGVREGAGVLPVSSAMSSSSTRFTSSFLPNHASVGPDDPRARVDEVRVHVVLIARVDEVRVQVVLIVAAPGDEAGLVDVAGEVAVEVEREAAVACLRSALRDRGLIKSLSSTFCAFDPASSAAKRLWSTTVSVRSSAALAGTDLFLGTTLNMVPPWKSACSGFDASNRFAEEVWLGRHVLHCVGDGPGYIDRHCLCDGHRCWSPPLPLPLPPLPLPLPLPSPLITGGPPAATRAWRTGQFRPMWPTSPHS